MSESCAPEDIALKALFLGPQSENALEWSHLSARMMQEWLEWRRSLFPNDGNAISIHDQNAPLYRERVEGLRQRSLELSKRFESEIPKFSPRYLGHMCSELSIPAVMGHWIAMLHNPNNVAHEASKVGIEIEREAINDLAQLVYGGAALGHFTSGGTVANFEALLRSRERLILWIQQNLSTENYSENAFMAGHRRGWLGAPLASGSKKLSWIQLSKLYLNKTGQDLPEPVFFVPYNAHYSWKKGINLLGFSSECLWPIELDVTGRMSIDDLKHKYELAKSENRPIAMIVANAGSTELGHVDPIHRVADWLTELKHKEDLSFWFHVDGAYGALFKSVSPQHESYLSDSDVLALQYMQRAQSISIDPHKLGYVPYACGAILFADVQDDRVVLNKAPYLQFEDDVDRGHLTLEGSRPATGACAVWLTSKVMGLNDKGLGRILARTLQLTRTLEAKLKERIKTIRIQPGCKTNILVFTFAEEGESLLISNRRAERVYQYLTRSVDSPFVVSKTTLDFNRYRDYLQSWVSKWSATVDQPGVLVLRVCIMNPYLDSKEMSVVVSDEFVQAVQNAIDMI